MNLAVFAVFAAMLGLFPFLSSYLVDLGADPGLAGGILAAYSAANIAGNAAGGLLADRRGRAWPVRTGLAGTAASLLLYAVPSVTAAAVAHALHGFAAGLATPAAFAWAGDRGRAVGHGRAMGRTGAAIAAAAVLAPAAGGLVAQRVGPAAVFGALAALAAAALWRTARADDGGAASPHARRGPDGPAWSLAAPALLGAYGAAPVIQAAFGLLIWLLPLQAQAAGAGSGPAGALMALLGAVAGAWMALGGSLADRRARPSVLAAGLAGLALGQAVLAGAGAPGAFWLRGAAGAAVFGTGFGVAFPAAAATVAAAAPPGQRGRAFSLFSIAFSVGAMASPAVGGLLVRRGWLAVPAAGTQPPAWWETPYILGILAAAAAAAAWLGPARWGGALISRRSGT